MQRKIPCVLMRGGTSRGPYFLASDLPSDPRRRDAVLLQAMGSPHALQVDGVGGSNPLTSKVAVVSPSLHPGADVDYLFAQVLVNEARVDTSPNCGNMLAGVAPFAIESGLVRARDPETVVRIRNVNTSALIEAIVQTPGGEVTYEGATRIDGAPGTAAPVALSFLSGKGSLTGKLLPTGRPVDIIDGIEVSCVDMVMPMVLMRATDLGKTGYEPPEEFDEDEEFVLAELDHFRRRAAALMGMGDVTDRVVPKIALLAPARHGGGISSRYFVPYSCHRSHAATGAICVATACAIPGTVAHGLVTPQDFSGGTLGVEHPSGRLEVVLDLERGGGAVDVRRASIVRTARRIFEGNLLVPEHVFA
jgi:2-methylaconitate cis-trans-isomerase PrpF